MKKKIILIGVLFLFLLTFSYSQTITVTSPHSGDTWYKGSSYTITWTHTGDMNEYVKIRLYQGSTKILGIEDSTENDGSYSWTVPEDLPAGTYYIRVKTVDNAVYDDGDTFTISDPMIKVTSPHSGDNWKKGESYTITWDHEGQMDSNVKIRLYQGNTRILPITNSTENDGSYRWTVPSDLPAGTYKIRVKTVDNRVYDDSDNFTIIEQSSSTTSNTGGRVRNDAGRPFIPLPDFRIARVDALDYNLGRIAVIIENIGNTDYRGRLGIGYTLSSSNITTAKGVHPVSYSSSFLTPETTFRHSGTMREKRFLINAKASRHSCANLEVRVNPGKRINETNFSNNLKSLLLPWIKESDGGIKEVFVKNKERNVFIQVFKKIRITKDILGEPNSFAYYSLELEAVVVNTGEKPAENYQIVASAYDVASGSKVALRVNSVVINLDSCKKKKIRATIGIPASWGKKFTRVISLGFYEQNNSKENRLNIFDDNLFSFIADFDLR